MVKKGGGGDRAQEWSLKHTRKESKIECFIGESEGETYRPKDIVRQIDKDTDTDRQADIWEDMEKDSDKETDRETEKQRQTERQRDRLPILGENFYSMPFLCLQFLH